jgi:hypothetical protein
MAAAAMLFTVGAAFADPGMLLIATGVTNCGFATIDLMPRHHRRQGRVLRAKQVPAG